MNINFEINLKKFSAIRVAGTLWESKIIKEEVRKYATTIFDAEGDDRENEKKWRNIIQKVIQLLESLQLSNDVFLKVRSTVVFTGEKVFKWVTGFMKAMGPFPFDQLYLPKISLTQHGIVDGWKDYQLTKEDRRGPLAFLYQPDSDLPGMDQLKLQTYGIASCYADEKLIRESLPKIAVLVKNVFGFKIKDLSKFKVNCAMTVLLCWHITIMDKDKSRIITFNTLYSNLKSKDYPTGADKMFLHCTDAGLVKPAEYFYKKLKETDKQSIVQQAVLKCLSETFMNNQVVLHSSLNEKTPEMVFYLLRKMTREQRRIFLFDKIAEVYATFLYYWPYQELCTPLLNYYWVNIPKLSKLRIWQAIFTFLKHNSGEKHYAFTSDIYQPLARDLLTRVPYDLKMQLWPSGNVIFNLFKIPDFQSIDVILEDPDSKTLRFMIIDISRHLSDWILIKGGNTKNIKDYMAHLKMSNEEKSKFLRFSKDPNLLNSLITSGRFEDAQDILTWRCASNLKEIMKVKKEIKRKSVAKCSEYVKSGKYDLIGKYLNWVCDDEKELAAKKKEILSTSFIRDQFWIVWISNRKESVKSAQKKCTKFLKYFFKTDDKVNSFKKEKIMKDEGMVKSVLDAAENMDYYPNFTIDFDEIAEFCSVPSDKVTDIKGKIINKIVWYFTFIGKTEQFLMLNALVNWLSDEKKKSILKLLNFNDTKVAAILLISHKLAAYSEAMKEERKILLLEWIKPYGDIEKLKKLFDEVKTVHENITKDDILKTKDLLDLCKITSESSLSRKLDHEL